MTVAITFGDRDAAQRGELVIDEETGSITLGGTQLSSEQWRKLTKGVDAVLTRKGFVENTVSVPTPVASGFIVRNLQALNRIRRGMVKKAPFPFSLFYDAVITKEEYRGI